MSRGIPLNCNSKCAFCLPRNNHNHGDETNDSTSRPSSPVTSQNHNNNLPANSPSPSGADPNSGASDCNSYPPPPPSATNPSSPRVSPSESTRGPTPPPAQDPVMGHPPLGTETYNSSSDPQQSRVSPSYEAPGNLDNTETGSNSAGPQPANDRVPEDPYNPSYRKNVLGSSREDYYPISNQNVTEKDRVHNSLGSSRGGSYPPQDGQPYPPFDSHPAGELRQYHHQNSPNPLTQPPYMHQNPPMQHSPSTVNPPDLGHKHRSSPFMHRDSPLSNESQHLHPHGSPHMHHDASSHSYHHPHHQNSPHLPITPLSYPGGRGMDSPHSHNSPLRKEGGGGGDGRYPLEYNPHRPSHHPMQQSPSPHRPYTDTLQMKDSPHLHEGPPQDQYHTAPPHQGVKSQHQGGHDAYWNMHMDALRLAFSFYSLQRIVKTIVFWRNSLEKHSTIIFLVRHISLQ